MEILQLLGCRNNISYLFLRMSVKWQLTLWEKSHLLHLWSFFYLNIVRSQKKIMFFDVFKAAPDNIRISTIEDFIGAQRKLEENYSLRDVNKTDWNWIFQSFLITSQDIRNSDQTLITLKILHSLKFKLVESKRPTKAWDVNFIRLWT